MLKDEGMFDTEYQMCYDSYRDGHWKTHAPVAYGDGTNETMHASARETWDTSWERLVLLFGSRVDSSKG